MYTEEQLRKQVLEAFRIGMAIGEKRGARSLGYSDETVNDLPHGTVRGHLTLIRGGAA